MQTNTDSALKFFKNVLPLGIQEKINRLFCIQLTD